MHGAIASACSRPSSRSRSRAKPRIVSSRRNRTPAPLASDDVAPHEALIDELDELIEHVDRRRFDDGLGLLEIEAALEDGQVMQGALRRRCASSSWLHAMAPASVRCRSGTFRGPEPGSGKVRGQSVANGRQREMGDAGGRQLHTERQPVHERAHLIDDGPVRPRLPTGSDGTRALDEQANTRVTERVERIFLFARDAQRRAARDQDPGAEARRRG